MQQLPFRRFRNLVARPAFSLPIALTALVLQANATVLQASGSPWENAVNALQVSFTGPIARGLSLVAVVVGGLMFAYGEGQSKRTMAGIIFGVGMALAAVNFVSWLFPGS